MGAAGSSKYSKEDVNNNENMTADAATWLRRSLRRHGVASESIRSAAERARRASNSANVQQRREVRRELIVLGRSDFLFGSVPKVVALEGMPSASGLRPSCFCCKCANARSPVGPLRAQWSPTTPLVPLSCACRAHAGAHHIIHARLSFRLHGPRRVGQPNCQRRVHEPHG